MGAAYSILGMDDCALLVVECFVCVGVFLCHNTAQQNRYIAQLLLAQAIAISCFLLFPLQFHGSNLLLMGYLAVCLLKSSQRLTSLIIKRLHCILFWC